MRNIVERWQSVTARTEPWWTLIGAPVMQEFIFRLLPYQLHLAYGRFYEIGIASALLFAAIHWYFGRWFVLYAFVWGLILWFVIVNYGFLWVVIIHSFVNVIHLRSGILPRKLK
ncbi:MAG: CPBP family intramembrane glutamic endopeptidase [Candidatus Sungiibacteriota bacterium]